MEYLVLARKWRPQIFEDVVGQEHVVRTLKNAIRHDRIAHAFIFSGPRGIGKTSVARIMAKALNCDQGPAETPCNVCMNCREVTEGSSVDVREIDGASNRGIDEIRELRENVKFAPLSCRYKVYIIDEVHMLTREAFNALLKTLEEPPPHVIFIFATTELHKVPATIISRCQCYDFKRVSLKQIADTLKKIATAEAIQVSEKGLKWIASAGDGSMRDALSIFDQAISYAGLQIADRDLEEILGLTDRRFLYLLSECVLERQAGKCLKTIEEAYYAGLDMKYFSQKLLEHFRNLLLVKILGPEHNSLDLAEDELASIDRQVKNVSRETLQRLLDILLAEEELVRRSLDPRLNLETALVRMAYLEPVIPIEDILSRMEGLEQRLSHQRAGGTNVRQQDVLGLPGSPDFLGADATAAKSDHPSRAETAREDQSLYAPSGEQSPDQAWENFKAFIMGQSYPLWSKIKPGRLLSLDKETLRIAFPRDYIFLEDMKAQKEKIADLAKDFFKDHIAVEIETLASDKETNHSAQSHTVNGNRVHELQHKALSHPVLQKVLDVFTSAEVREVIPRNHKIS